MRSAKAAVCAMPGMRVRMAKRGPRSGAASLRAFICVSMAAIWASQRADLGRKKFQIDR
jgi:hypothetical protein